MACGCRLFVGCQPCSSPAHLPSPSANVNHLQSNFPFKCPRFWDTRAGKNTATVTTPGANLYLSWSPDSHYVAVANRDDVVSIIDARWVAWRGLLGVSSSGSCHRGMLCGW